MMTMEVRSRDVRSRGKNHQNRSGRKSAGWNEIFESPTWLDSRDFKAYRDMISEVLFKAGRPLCTREIHSALGTAARPAWTLDALETGKYFGRQGVLITRYFMVYGPHRKSIHKLDQDEEHNRIFEN